MKSKVILMCPKKWICTDCGICVGNLDIDMYNHKCKPKDLKNHKKYLKSEKNKA